MQHSRLTSPGLHRHPDEVESSASGVSWSAVIAGAVIAAAVSAMLITGGSGFGLLFLSPWHHEGMPTTPLAFGSIVWMLATQIIAYGLGGYIAGRLRTKWTDAEVDEIYFRDTAHGFLVWALSALAGLVLLGSMAASIVSGTTRTETSATRMPLSPSTMREAPPPPSQRVDYLADILLRPADPAASPIGGSVQPEVLRILEHSMAQGWIAEADRPYLVATIIRHAGVDSTIAEQRLVYIQEQAKQTEQRAREVADTARKAAVAFSLWAFASLLIGAFVASFAATIGGRSRDRWIASQEIGSELDDGDMPLDPPNNRTV